MNINSIAIKKQSNKMQKWGPYLGPFSKYMPVDCLIGSYTNLFIGF